METYDIDFIVGHILDKDQRMFMQVRWIGHDEDADTRILVDELQQQAPDIVIDYLGSNLEFAECQREYDRFLW